ncbi:MAG: hypothetical protein C0423_01455 [Methylibium sp.]|nr:hypothetical protein [Methylibium sp.]
MVRNFGVSATCTRFAMIAKTFASFGLLICLGLALHMCLGRRQQLKLEQLASRLMAWFVSATSRPFDRRERRLAAHQAAMDAIKRAQRSSHTEPAPLDGSWEGNVYRPKRFDQKPQKPH